MGEGGENYPSKRAQTVPTADDGVDALLAQKDNEIASLKQQIQDLKHQLHVHMLESMKQAVELQKKIENLHERKLDPRLLQQQELLTQKQQEINKKYETEAEAARADAKAARADAKAARAEAEAVRADADKRVREMKEEVEAARADADKRVRDVAYQADRRVEDVTGQANQWMDKVSGQVRTFTSGMIDANRCIADAAYAFSEGAFKFARRDQEMLPRIHAARKLLAGQDSIGSQIVREEAESQYLAVTKYYLLDGTRSGIEQEAHSHGLDLVGSFVATPDLDKAKDAFFAGGQAFITSKAEPVIGMFMNVERDGDSWLWTDCGEGNQIFAKDFETALFQTIRQMDDTESTMILDRDLDALSISIEAHPIDLQDLRKVLRTSVVHSTRVVDELKTRNESDLAQIFAPRHL